MGESRLRKIAEVGLPQPTVVSYPNTLEMKTLLALLALAALFSGCAQEAARPLPTASHVDLKRYSGQWYEIARLPNFFQRDDSSAIAEYTPNPDGSVRVRNTELRPNGTRKAIEGRADAVLGSEQARLKVRFGGLAGLAPVSKEGNYWIIEVAPDYSMALVGTPDRKYLWLLARSPKPNVAKRDHLIAKARSLGFPVDKLIVHPVPSA